MDKPKYIVMRDYVVILVDRMAYVYKKLGDKKPAEYCGPPEFTVFGYELEIYQSQNQSNLG